MASFIIKEEISFMKKIIYLILVLFSCGEIKRTPTNTEIKYIMLRDYNIKDRIDPFLIFYTELPEIDTTYYNWRFNIIVENSILKSINNQSSVFQNELNLKDTSYKSWFYIDICYLGREDIKSIKIPMEKGVEYFDMLIKILEENKIKDLEIAVKKLNYMKD